MKKQLTKFIVAILTAASLVIGSLGSASAAAPDYLIISRDSLMALPANGTAWNSLKSKADASVSPDLCNQDNKADVNALAAGIVYARTGNTAYRTKVINLINAMMATQKDGCGNAVLAMGRQLGGYVMAADFAGYRDPSFTNWLNGIIDHNIGGHSRWFNLRFTAYDSASNWGLHALASTTTADIYLNRTADIEKDWQVFSGYGIPHGWPFNKASSYNEQWSCVATDATGKLPVAINPPCTKSGINLDGAPVEDSSREAFGSYSTYIHEGLQGYTVMAQLFNRTGRNGWTVNDSQVCRVAKFSDRAGRLNDNSVSYFVAFMANNFCSLNLPTKTPTSGGRMFGFSDWLFSAPSTIGSSPTPTSTLGLTKTPTVTPTPTFIPTSTLGLTKTPTVTPTPTFIPTSITSGPTNTPTETPMVTPIPAVSDLILADGFEGGSFSAWSSANTGTGGLSVSPLAALVDSNGMQVVINGITNIYTTDNTPNAEPHYRARFYFDPNSISMADGNAHYIFMGYDTSAVFNIDFRFSGGNYQIRLRTLDDSQVAQSTAFVPISDAAHFIEMEWWAASAAGANNGGVNLWIDDVLRGSVTSVDNDTRRIDSARLGAVAGIKAGTLGTYYLDAFESRPADIHRTLVTLGSEYQCK